MNKSIKLDDTSYLERISKNLLKTLLLIASYADQNEDSEYRGYLILEDASVCGVPKHTNNFTLIELDSNLEEFRNTGLSISTNYSIPYNDNPNNVDHKIIGYIGRYSDVVEYAELNGELLRLINDNTKSNNIIIGNF